jgi:hypothetical protein
MDSNSDSPVVQPVASRYTDYAGYETWLLVIREEPELRVFENRALRRTFGPKSDGRI